MSEQIPKEQMEAVDKLYWTPSERATGVHNMIREVREVIRKANIKSGLPPDTDIPSDLDLLCYAVEYMGMQAIAIGEETFQEIAIAASRWLYSVHYSNPGRLWGEPDREREDETVREGRTDVPGSDGSGGSGGSAGDTKSSIEAQGDSKRPSEEGN